jgi:hypothetical protein
MGCYSESRFHLLGGYRWDRLDTQEAPLRVQGESRNSELEAQLIGTAWLIRTYFFAYVLKIPFVQTGGRETLLSYTVSTNLR